MTQSLAVRTEGLGSDLIGHSSVSSFRRHEADSNPLEDGTLRTIAKPVLAVEVDFDRLHITTELL